MANCVLVPSSISAMNVDAYTRSVISKDNVDIANGTPLVMGKLSTEAGKTHCAEVEVANAPKAGIWMAYSPEVTQTVTGEYVFKNVMADPREFTNVAGQSFDAFFVTPQVDIIQVTAEFFANGASPADVTGATVVEMNASGEFAALAEATDAYTGCKFEIMDTDVIHIATGKLGGNGVTAWRLRCVQN